MPIQDANTSPFQSFKGPVMTDEDVAAVRATNRPRAPRLRLPWAVYFLLVLMLAVQVLHFELDREDYNIRHGFTSQSDRVKW